ncbi:uncharacterized protein LOC143462830 [Clavelina lepadiformis]|uniref:uncharacterized protein LOC143462830 n=1 Tax=Clavelina lepadiformis TaxID=159417 RepID=UPI0040415559
MKEMPKIVVYVCTIFLILSLDVISLTTPEWLFIDIKYGEDPKNVTEAILGLWRICLKESNGTNCYPFPSQGWNDLVRDAGCPCFGNSIGTARWTLLLAIPFLLLSGLLAIKKCFQALNWMLVIAVLCQVIGLSAFTDKTFGRTGEGQAGYSYYIGWVSVVLSILTMFVACCMFCKCESTGNVSHPSRGGGIGLSGGFGGGGGGGFGGGEGGCDGGGGGECGGGGGDC